MEINKKIDCLIESLGLSDFNFSKKFSIPLSKIRAWRKGKSIPTRDDVSFLCEQLNFDVDDFLNPSSTVSYKNISNNEHMCLAQTKQDDSNTIFEDFPREDNSRYEEKD